MQPLNRTQISSNPEQTKKIGRAFATRVNVGDIIALIGPLGAGKTEFVKGLVEGLGMNEAISSPTFTLLHEYTTQKAPVYHLDFYRLKNEKEAYCLGLEDLSDGIVVIEWADRFPAILSSTHWQIKITPTSDTSRLIQINQSSQR